MAQGCVQALLLVMDTTQPLAVLRLSPAALTAQLKAATAAAGARAVDRQSWSQLGGGGRGHGTCAATPDRLPKERQTRPDTVETFFSHNLVTAQCRKISRGETCAWTW